LVVADDHAGLRAARCWRRRPINAAMCIFCVTRLTTYHAGPSFLRG
jgi:hypothetical protein